ncbi:hypothetical protein GQF56_17725 [Rhodobacter sphaeroides]|jgi:Transcriptional activator, adenine-specific DNA methyltransferase|uniref:Transcriptional activator, adenine-specific DNA methyltransferase n=1 Tax=Cereibacter sphaeroides (strain ATCC 17023 / DSM 158 / JCM 6121 / CCUG 31486 / LMG 2827 / NBRC 12203 / NCIMB 8253 / ATH 2.4.1.) TaxID=272943 RepID=Q3IX13_CERS4|nr:MT-A70 family methyltransferase [Cereibacter sphaeroides]ABA80921.1 transcriptional activator, adenine-specific DNA methyltransferase [Cereibacter sphaeroides 2.4.1]AMJ49248.1 hypothetical protein APX01_16920 [Cereibacter sphaeroides]ANS35955.1 hypothetical protein A3858_16920 [Cereibacter sphaeroides]ATN65019.1 hypothetical protein A3857_16935 [Cereibacter sphaeroides]AXC63217.1 hypothetical protein DQL45_17650 [Cereibacter sphaeroides 2.4.1]
MNDAARELIEMRPAGGFDVILADPPWRFASNSEAKPGRNAIRHYRCMKVGEIEALPVKAIAAPDALCLMWVTVPFAERAFRVLRAWGFAYGSQLVWRAMPSCSTSPGLAARIAAAVRGRLKFESRFSAILSTPQLNPHSCGTVWDGMGLLVKENACEIRRCGVPCRPM